MDARRFVRSGRRLNVALDTNVLAYAEGVNGKSARDVTLVILERLSAHDVYIPVQVLGELHAVIRRKARRSAADAKTAILAWSDAYKLVETTAAMIAAAADLAEEHELGFWDSVILSAASSAQCRVLLSEDMQDGFTWRGTTVVNPYAKELHPLLAAALT